MYRLNGRFISKKFGSLLEDLAKDAGRSDVQKFINENASDIKNFYENGVAERHYNEDKVFSNIENFRGKIYVNGELTSKGLAMKQVAEFNSLVKNALNGAGSSYKVNFSLFGKEMYLNIPMDQFNEMLEEDTDEADLFAFLEDEGIYSYGSSKKK